MNSDGELSDEENSIMNHDPLLSDANHADNVPDLGEELIASYGDGVLDDNQLTVDPEMEAIFNAPSEQPLDFSRQVHALSDSKEESDDEQPHNKNPLRKLLKQAEMVFTVKFWLLIQ
jgi:hypothetical protein